MRLTIRSRFALVSALLVLAVGSLVALGGYLALRSSLLAQAGQEAGDQARQLAALVDVPGVPSAAGQPENLVDLTDPSLTRDFVRGGLPVQVLRPGGALIQASPGARQVQPGAALLSSCLRIGLASGRRDRWIVSCRRVGTAARPAGLVLVGAPLDGALSSLARLRNALGIGLAAGVVLAALAGLVLGRRALRPARRIAETAETIRSGDLSRRIGYRGPRDELGAVAEILDECFAELELAVDRQRRFVADASHEMKTPIAAVRAHAELLRGWAATEPDARAAALSSLDQAARRMGRLVGDLLYLTELDRTPPVARLPVALDALVLAVAAEAGPLRPDVAVRLRRLDEAVVTGDEIRLQALLLNLIDNAMRVSPPGGEVSVSVAADEVATVEVVDRGPGIAAEALDRIFDRFYQAPARDRTRGGTGLGLAIAREIARAHGGDLTAANDPAGGAVLRVVLPLEGASTNLHPAITDPLPRGHTVRGD